MKTLTTLLGSLIFATSALATGGGTVGSDLAPINATFQNHSNNNKLPLTSDLLLVLPRMSNDSVRLIVCANSVKSFDPQSCIRYESSASSQSDAYVSLTAIFSDLVTQMKSTSQFDPVVYLQVTEWTFWSGEVKLNEATQQMKVLDLLIGKPNSFKGRKGTMQYSFTLRPTNAYPTFANISLETQDLAKRFELLSGKVMTVRDFFKLNIARTILPQHPFWKDLTQMQDFNVMSRLETNFADLKTELKKFDQKTYIETYQKSIERTAMFLKLNSDKYVVHHNFQVEYKPESAAANASTGKAIVGILGFAAAAAGFTANQAIGTLK